MTEAEKIAGAIGALRDAYPRQEFPAASVAMYARQLRDLGGDAVIAAVERLIRRSEWLPSIAEIRREVAAAEIGGPSAEEAWAILTCASVEQRIALVDDNPVARMAYAAVGGRAGVSMSTAPERTRAAFVETYRSVAEARIRQRAEVTRATLGPTMESLPVTTAFRERDPAEGFDLGIVPGGVLREIEQP